MATGSAAASHTKAATVRVLQRGTGNRRVRSESIMRSEPSADPAAGHSERRNARELRRYVERIACAPRRRLAGAKPLVRATRSARWRSMSREVFHSTCARIERQRGGGGAHTERFALGFGLRSPCTKHRASRNVARRPAACPTPSRNNYFEIASSAMPRVRGPMNPIAAITITIAPAMNANTPNVPKPLSTAAITNDEKIAEKRLHE